MRAFHRHLPTIHLSARFPCPSRFVLTVASLCNDPLRTTRRTWETGDLALTYMECFSSATNLFGFLRLSEIVVE